MGGARYQAQARIVAKASGVAVLVFRGKYTRVAALVLLCLPYERKARLEEVGLAWLPPSLAEWIWGALGVGVVVVFGVGL